MDTLETLLSKINNKLKDSKLFYLSNDPERALGLERLIENYVVVHIDENEYIDDFEKYGIKYFCLSKERELASDFFRSSIKLIRDQKFLEFFHKEKSVTNYFQTFKISPAFEFSVKELGGILLNTSAELNHLYEDKISQYQILSKLNIQLPKTKIVKMEEINYMDVFKEFGAIFVLQFARGHTGSSTIFINNEQEFIEIKNKFIKRTVKISESIEGIAYTLNCCTTKHGVFMGGLSKQVTGIKELTPMLGGTVGNDWSNQTDFIKGLDELKNEIRIIGEKMYQDGYRGMFGLDLIVKNDGSFVFIEINARQPASIPMYTKLQLIKGQIPLSLIHLAEFLNIEYQIDIEQYNKTNMERLIFCQIFIRAPQDLIIRTRFQSGIYRLQGDNAGYNPITGKKAPNSIFLDERQDKSLIFQNSEGIILKGKSEEFMGKFPLP
jgi:predicted ATP-grasp superfamily ATP-dependent carboligase